MIVALCALPSSAFAYDEEVHSFLVRAALANSGLDQPAAPIPPDAPALVRRTIDTLARTSTDAAIAAEWKRRYPAPEAFDAWAEKELLLLSPEANVFGIDRLPDPVKTSLEAIELGAREPDDDRRNRDRFAYDAERKRIDNTPADPAILNMGKLGALSSQAHAHYGLAEVSFSSDPAVLKSDPRRFAVASGYAPGPVLTLAAEMAETHLELALLAALEEQPSETLAWLYTGQAMHYLQDVGNQIHTVQVGIYDFFVDATLARLFLAARTGGGYLGELRTMPSIGIDILTNHHVLSEQLTKKRVIDALAGRATPEGSKLLDAPKHDDAALASAIASAAADGPFGFALTKAVIEASSHEGADVYAATRAIAQSRFRKVGVLYDEHREDPDQCIVDAASRDRAAYDRLFELEEHGFTRAGTAMRKWIALERAAFAPAALEPADRERARRAIVERFARRQLRLLSEAEARRADYLAHPPATGSGSGPEHMPLMLLGEVVLAIVLVVALWWFASPRRRRAL